MKITFLGATRTVTGSCYLLRVGNRNIMVDCGLYQGAPDLQERNYTHPPVNWTDIDTILITHAHMDHSGLVPRAVKLGFRGDIYATGATIDLAEIMLRDSAEIQESEADWISRKRERAGKTRVEPLYTINDVPQALERFRSVKYSTPVEIAPGIRVEYKDAGHILGSASIKVEAEENGLKRAIVFSGDIGHHRAPILKEPDGFTEADLVLIETTYGNRLHESTKERWTKLAEIVRQAVNNRGKVVIPAFTVGRTQELLYILGEMMSKGEIPTIPIYLDSPMAISATNVHVNHPECFDAETVARIKRHENPFKPISLKLSRTVDESRKINNVSAPVIIIAGGGMCQGGRVVHHLKHNIWKEENQIVFVGYQAEGTLGRHILDGAKFVRLFGDEVAVRAKVKAIGAFSAHADRDGLLEWLGKYKTPPGLCCLIHGEIKSTEAFSESVKEKLGYQAYIPRLHQEIDLADIGKIVDGKRAFTSLQMPDPSQVLDIAARMSMANVEDRSKIEKYAADLGRRVQAGEQDSRLPEWGKREAAEVIERLGEVVDGGTGRLRELISSTGSDEGDDQVI